MNHATAISIIVPTLNEEDNVNNLVHRLDIALQQAEITYEIIFVDDHSRDETVERVQLLAKDFPVRVELKKGQRGKAFSLIEGFDLANYPLIAMIDADLQYPPEAFVAMHKLLVESNADIVITDRIETKTSLLRKLSSFIFNLFFVRLLFGITFDTQSGQKLFKKEVIEAFDMKPTPWSFDLEFLVRALENKRKIISYSIPFSDRTSGVTKINIIQSSIELAVASIKLRWRTSFRKTRSGNRANSRFLDKAFPMSLLAIISLTLPLLAAPKTDALSLSDITKPVTTQVTETTAGLFDFFNLTQPATPAPTVTNPRTNSSAASSSNASPASNGVTSDTETAGDTPITTPTNTSTQNTSNAAKSAPIDNSDLAPATANGQSSSAYKKPFSLSQSFTNNASQVIKYTLYVGVALVISAILLVGINKLAKVLTRKQLIRD